eukprot:TRINITY_DN7478_c3_g1_i1.p1 TRINITY_DN7478_c3_g1~~TRINITY_DN7478_c3_g1_i1.p1  ORF type:complete len:551 (-),score=146.70 TRINITY_DN7478_c3_g1_i1:127-1659(-)
MARRAAEKAAPKVAPKVKAAIPPRQFVEAKKDNDDDDGWAVAGKGGAKASSMPSGPGRGSQQSAPLSNASLSKNVAGRQVVIDAGAAIRLQRLERFGGELFTTGGVYSEVKDERAKALLKTLPVELKVREPLPADLAYTKQFAKQTGDLGFLSHNDMDLIALTVRLHREKGIALKDRPAALATAKEGSTVSFDWAPQHPVRKNQSSVADSSEVAPSTSAAPEEDDGWAVAGRGGAKSSSTKTSVAPRKSKETEKETETPSISADPSPKEEVEEAPELDKDGDDDAEDDEDELSEDGSSAGEWVTADNMHRFGIGVEADDDVTVTCATADYSCQNVLLQMGITPLTFDGYAVKSVKMWGLICRACQFFHRDSQKVFCPKCGNDTVVRVPIMIGQDGVPTVMNLGRKLRTKGTVFSMPKPQGGRNWKPIMAEDEARLGGRDREQRRLEKVWEKERMARDPFDENNGARAWYQRGTTATGKQITSGAPRIQAGFGRRTNPNAGNFKGFKPKRR